MDVEWIERVLYTEVSIWMLCYKMNKDRAKLRIFY